jgi:hypothetical protein
VFLSVGNNRGSLALSPGGRTFMPWGRRMESSRSLSSRALQLRDRSLAVPGFSGGFPVAGLGPLAGIDHSNQFHPHRLRAVQSVGGGRILGLVEMF